MSMVWSHNLWLSLIFDYISLPFCSLFVLWACDMTTVAHQSCHHWHHDGIFEPAWDLESCRVCHVSGWPFSDLFPMVHHPTFWMVRQLHFWWPPLPGAFASSSIFARSWIIILALGGSNYLHHRFVLAPTFVLTPCCSVHLFDQNFSTPTSTLRLLHYYPHTDYEHGEIGVGAHTDYGGLTILLQGIGGLQVCAQLYVSLWSTEIWFVGA